MFAECCLATDHEFQVMLCSFRGFGKDSNGNFPQQYWRENTARLSFIIIFEVRCVHGSEGRGGEEEMGGRGSGLGNMGEWGGEGRRGKGQGQGGRGWEGSKFSVWFWLHVRTLCMYYYCYFRVLLLFIHSWLVLVLGFGINNVFPKVHEARAALLLCQKRR